VKPPLLNSPGPSYAELFSKSAFSQRKFLSTKKFADGARRRSITIDPRFSRQLMRLDRIDALCPVAFSQANYDVETTWLDPDPEYMHWREERNFELWRAHAWISPVSKTPWISEQYSPWQLLYLEEALALDVPPAALSDLDERWRPTIKLLVALQTRLWPYRKQKTTLLRREGDGQTEHIDPHQIEVERFLPRQLLDNFGLDLDGLARLHAEFADAATALDPAPQWYRLAELAPRTQTDEFRGHALKARDLRDASYLLRLLYHLATERWLPRADELAITITEEATRRRHLPRQDSQSLGATHDELQPALETAGLYPHRIHFIVEGDTEEIVLGRLLEELGRTSGYQLTNLRGVDKAERHKTLLAAASQYAARMVLIADMEGSLSEVLRRLQRDGLLTDPQDLLLWQVGGQPSSFEEVNFRPEEIVQAIQTAARKRVPNIDLGFSGEELAAHFALAVENAQRRKCNRPAFGQVALRMAQQHNIRVSKTELACELADINMRLTDEAGSLYGAANPDRPLLQSLWQWLTSD
jgi:hypothetical protein